MGIGKSPGWQTTGNLGDSAAAREGRKVPHTTPIPCTIHLFYLATPELNPFIINQ